MTSGWVLIASDSEAVTEHVDISASLGNLACEEVGRLVCKSCDTAVVKAE